jgi:micrococcal nuclease
VKLVIDPLEGDKDKYGRLLRYVYFEDGTMLNDRLVYEGYAFAYEKFPTARTEALKKMEKDARENKRGLWGGCDVTIKDGGKQKSTQSLKE